MSLELLTTLFGVVAVSLGLIAIWIMFGGGWLLIVPTISGGIGGGIGAIVAVAIGSGSGNGAVGGGGIAFLATFILMSLWQANQEMEATAEVLASTQPVPNEIDSLDPRG